MNLEEIYPCKYCGQMPDVDPFNIQCPRCKNCYARGNDRESVVSAWNNFHDPQRFNDAKTKVEIGKMIERLNQIGLINGVSIPICGRDVWFHQRNGEVFWKLPTDTEWKRKNELENSH